MRKISIKNYIIAAIITSLVLFSVIILGALFDNSRISFLQRQSELQRLNYESLQFQYLFLDSLSPSNESCAALSVALERTIDELFYSLDRIEKYEKESAFNEPDYALILRKYLLDNIKYWYLAKRAKEMCNLDIVILLYFFASEKTCPECKDQSVIISNLKKKFEDRLLVFPINADLGSEEPMFEILQKLYAIEKYPTIVIDEQKEEGYVPKNRLLNIICEHFKINEHC